MTKQIFWLSIIIGVSSGLVGSIIGTVGNFIIHKTKRKKEHYASVIRPIEDIVEQLDKETQIAIVNYSMGKSPDLIGAIWEMIPRLINTATSSNKIGDKKLDRLIDDYLCDVIATFDATDNYCYVNNLLGQDIVAERDAFYRNFYKALPPSENKKYFRKRKRKFKILDKYNKKLKDVKKVCCEMFKIASSNSRKAFKRIERLKV